MKAATVRLRRCDRGHIGGPGVRVGTRGCIHAGPLGLAVVLGLATAAAAASNPAIPWWGVVVAFVFWPAVSIIGQVLT